MTLRLVLAERLYHGVPVFGVDPEQLKQHEANGAALTRRAGLRMAPQRRVNPPQVVVDHRSNSEHEPALSSFLIIRGLPADHLVGAS
jgi:hypothetical protein